MRTILVVACFLTAGVFQALFAASNPNIQITGDTNSVRETMTFVVTGPECSETGDPNPFTDYLFIVRFQYMLSGAEIYMVPGYFAADGNAGQTGADSGNIWKAHWTPQWLGPHEYRIIFRQGKDIAISGDTTAGTPVAGIDGDTGTVHLTGESEKQLPDLRCLGRVDYDQYKTYLVQVKNSFEKLIFMKMGVSSPSNFLNFADFDNTPENTYRKTWATHVTDWQQGDTTWGSGGKGKGIIGALNYLGAKGVNTISFNTLTVGGTDNNVFPYTAPDSLTRFDCSKLDQWQTVFNHANQKGIVVELRTQLAANQSLLDNGDLGPQRKLYYRELIARFSHNLGLFWNLGDENTQTTAQRKAMANFLWTLDPYSYPGRPILLSVPDGTQDAAYTPLQGDSSLLTGLALQTNWNAVHKETKKWVDSCRWIAIRYWHVFSDFQLPKATGVPVEGFTGTPNQDDIRKQVLWGNLMAGGAGVSYVFGSQDDLTCQGFSGRDKLWEYNRYATDFFLTYIGNSQMPMQVNSNNLLSDTTAFCMSYTGGHPFVVYLPNGGTTNIDLSGTLDSMKVWWYNPRTGGNVIAGVQVVGGAEASIGNPPEDAGQDWVALIVPDTGSVAGVKKNKTAGTKSFSMMRTYLAHNGLVKIPVPMVDAGTIEIVGFNGKVVASLKNAGSRLAYRCKAKGMYLLCATIKGKRTILGRIIYL